MFANKALLLRYGNSTIDQCYNCLILMGSLRKYSSRYLLESDLVSINFVAERPSFESRSIVTGTLSTFIDLARLVDNLGKSIEKRPLNLGAPSQASCFKAVPAKWINYGIIFRLN